jgi:molecular chaperone DnaK
MSDVVGIDLGTTISLLGVADPGGRVTLARTRDGGPRLRSVVHVSGDGAPTVGEAAQRLAPLEPDSCFAFFKRWMGTPWRVEAGSQSLGPEQLSGFVLDALREDAASIGAAPRRAVVTIPAYFGDDARRATQRAGELAGLEVVALLHEPTAACMAAGNGDGGPRTVLVYDLGGGTFDVSVVRFEQGEAEVRATAGDHRLGGKDWDDVLVELVAGRIEAEVGEDPREDPGVLADLQERCREAKHTLSRLERAGITIFAGGRAHRLEVGRAEFAAATATLLARTEEIVTQVVEEVGGAGAIDAALLVGGSTRMPGCGDVVRRASGRAPAGGVDPDEAVVTGAALVARAAAGGGALTRRMRDVTAHALGFVVVASDGSRYVNEVMIRRNAPIPAVATKRHRLDVAAGAPGQLHVHMLQGESERPLDVQPLGCWTFADVPAARTGQVDVDVTYRYDEDGVVHVSAAVGGRELAPPRIDREDRDLRWTDEDPEAHRTPSLAVALVIDVSGSMEGAKLAQAKAACRGFVDELEQAGAGDRVAVVAFGSTATLVARVGDEPRLARRALDAVASAGSTNMAAGLAAAEGELGEQAGARVVVLLTDGYPDDEAATLSARARLIERDVQIVARGVDGANAAFVRRLSTGDGEMLDLANLSGSFRGIARQLAQDGALRRRGA